MKAKPSRITIPLTASEYMLLEDVLDALPKDDDTCAEMGLDDGDDVIVSVTKSKLTLNPVNTKERATYLDYFPATLRHNAKAENTLCDPDSALNSKEATADYSRPGTIRRRATMYKKAAVELAAKLEAIVGSFQLEHASNPAGVCSSHPAPKSHSGAGILKSTTPITVSYQYTVSPWEVLESEATFELPDELLPTAEEICDCDDLVVIRMDEWFLPQLALKHGVPATAIHITGRQYV